MNTSSTTYAFSAPSNSPSSTEGQVLSLNCSQSHLRQHIHTLAAKCAHLLAHFCMLTRCLSHTESCGIWNSLSSRVIFFSFPYLLGKVFFRNAREERTANSLLWFFCLRLDQPRSTCTLSRAHKSRRGAHTDKRGSPLIQHFKKSITSLSKKP